MYYADIISQPFNPNHYHGSRWNKTTKIHCCCNIANNNKNVKQQKTANLIFSVWRSIAFTPCRKNHNSALLSYFLFDYCKSPSNRWMVASRSVSPDSVTRRSEPYRERQSQADRSDSPSRACPIFHKTPIFFKAIFFSI